MTKAWQFCKNTLLKTLYYTPVFLAVNDCVLGTASVHGRSMQPALSDTDFLAVEKVSVRLYKFHRGDVVLLR